MLFLNVHFWVHFLDIDVDGKYPFEHEVISAVGPRTGVAGLQLRLYTLGPSSFRLLIRELLLINK